MNDTPRNNRSEDTTMHRATPPLQLPHDVEPPSEPMTPSTPSTALTTKRRSKKHLLTLGIIGALLIAAAAGSAFYLSRPKSTLPVTSTAPGAKAPSTTTPPSAVTIPDAIGTIDPSRLPLGQDKVSTTPQGGYVYSCQASFSSTAGGAQVAGPWINTTTKTWDSTAKVAVSGSVSWASAAYATSLTGTERIITANDLPINGQTTGTFPVASSDKAYSYDRNPNSITAQTLTWTLPATPAAADQPHCLPGGAIGILTDGVILFSALDGEGRDAAAYETLDSCDGHPERTSEYHHHDIPKCLLSKYQQPSSSTLVGYATDGYGIYIERDRNGALLTNANLDVCHGRTSTIMWDGKLTSLYHYVATLEFPYTLGCFHGTSAVAAQSSTPPGGGASGQTGILPPPRQRQ